MVNCRLQMTKWNMMMIETKITNRIAGTKKKTKTTTMTRMRIWRRPEALLKGIYDAAHTISEIYMYTYPGIHMQLFFKSLLCYFRTNEYPSSFVRSPSCKKLKASRQSTESPNRRQRQSMVVPGNLHEDFAPRKSSGLTVDNGGGRQEPGTARNVIQFNFFV